MNYIYVYSNEIYLFFVMIVSFAFTFPPLYFWSLLLHITSHIVAIVAVVIPILIVLVRQNINCASQNGQNHIFIQIFYFRSKILFFYYIKLNSILNILPIAAVVVAALVRKRRTSKAIFICVPSLYAVPPMCGCKGEMMAFDTTKSVNGSWISRTCWFIEKNIMFLSKPNWNFYF